jgi:titin
MGTLRQALVDANAANTGTAVNPDLIQFNIPTTDPGYQSGTGAFSIQPLSALPTFTDTVILDGYTQPGASLNTLAVGDNAVLKIVLDGSQAGTNVEGLVITGSNCTVRGLVIDNFDNNGIFLIGNQNLVAGNLIGTSVTGLAALGNGGGRLGGIRIGGNNTTIGGTTAAARNIISGNGIYGIWIETAGGSAFYNLVEGNYIGTDITGTRTLSVRGGQYGIYIDSANNTIGGTTPEARNIISGNGTYGIVIDGRHLPSNPAFGNAIEGNYIGTDASGTLAVPNAYGGIELLGGLFANTIGGTLPGAGNVIAGGGNAILIEVDPRFTGVPTNNLVQGNLIGTDKTGTVALGNGVGIELVGANNTTIGGTAAGAGNTIAFSREVGVGVYSGTGNSIRGNSIFANGALGIDLGEDGVTLNTPGGPHTGPNNLQNFPVLTNAVAQGNGRTRVIGALNSTANTTFTLDFYANATADPSGYGQGQRYLGSAIVTTNANGDVHFSVDLSAATVRSEWVSATATDPAGNTSEFCLDEQVGGGPQLVVGGAGGSQVPPAAGGGADTTTSDQVLAGLLGPVGAAAPFVADSSGTRGQTESPLVAQEVFAASPVSAHTAESPPPALSRSPSTGTLDRLFADWLSSGLADALPTDTLLTPLA